ncbi:MAG: RNA 2',3'-cyclic phosphodiesterase [Rhodoferax sp.]
MQMKTAGSTGHGRAGALPGRLSVTGIDPAQQPTDRLFFAIFPDAAATARIAQLAQRLRAEHSLHGHPLKTERFHVTLHHLGDHVGLRHDIVAAASEAAATIAMPPFELAFDRVMSFDSRPRIRPLVLRGGDGLAALTRFRQSLGTAMAKAGLGRWVETSYTPHVTLLYDDRPVAGQPVETIAWTARKFVLVRSLLGQTLHVPLARWPLRG